jgi:hypothetical protein
MTTFPVSGPIQFAPAAGTLFVDDLVDPSGAPTTVLDIDDGFTIKGRVVLPGWLSGKGLVRITADEKGGPIDKSIGQQVILITGASTPADPPAMTYPFQIEVKSPTLPDDSKMYDLGVVFVFQTAAGGHTDIGGFYDLGAFLVV